MVRGVGVRGVDCDEVWGEVEVEFEFEFEVEFDVEFDAEFMEPPTAVRVRPSIVDPSGAECQRRSGGKWYTRDIGRRNVGSGVLQRHDRAPNQHRDRHRHQHHTSTATSRHRHRASTAPASRRRSSLVLHNGVSS